MIMNCFGTKYEEIIDCANCKVRNSCAYQYEIFTKYKNIKQMQKEIATLQHKVKMLEEK